MLYSVGIITLSDKGSEGLREDMSGPKIKELLPKNIATYGQNSLV